MDVSKSGYYKWRFRRGKLNRYEQDRQLLTSFLCEQHNKHLSYGYHMLAKAVFEATGWVFSHNLAHKCCKQAGIRSQARKCPYKKPGEEHVKFPNEVKGNWNAKRPIEIVVSDMTIFKNNGRNWEWTLLVDTFNNEILAHQATPIQGNTKPYYHCLEQLKQLDLTGLDVSSITNTESMFDGTQLESIICSESDYDRYVKEGNLSADTKRNAVTIPDGDVDGNGKVDEDDIAEIRQYVVDEGGDFDVELADVNHDGNIDLKDVVALKEIVLAATEAV